MKPKRAWWGALCHFAAYAGIALVHCRHEPELAALYALLLCGELLRTHRHKPRQ